MGTLDEQEEFFGNDRHFKMLRRAVEAENISLWNEFTVSMGPQFHPDLRGVNLENQILTGIRLVAARLDDACFDGADLSGADLSRATLTGATFRNAVLVGTKLRVPVKVKAKKAPTAEIVETDPAARKRQKLALMQEQAQALLEERKQKEQAQKKLEAKVKERNRPQPFKQED